MSSENDVAETVDGTERARGIDPIVGLPPPITPGRDYPELIEVARDHYVMGGEIAKGGMGRVFEARDLRLGRDVAIKELLPRNRDAARRFEREARITARLQHPAIINIHEAGVWAGGEPFYAMTRVTGRSLDQVVAERTTLAERLGLLPNVIAIADALAYAHSQQIIHRDLKPSNVLLGAFGETVVIDWGLAKDLAGPLDPAMSLQLKQQPDDTLTGSVVGTPAYMPPEQARGEPVDQRADVYALGALLYQVLVGSAPYTGKRSNDVLEQVLAGAPTPVEEREPGAPADLVTIVAKAMNRDLDARYPTASELAADLKRFQTGQLVAAHHYSRWQLFWRWVRRNRLALAIASAAVITLAVVGWLSVRRIVDERNRAELEQRKDELRRAALLEERGRAELSAGRAGPALVNLAGAVRGKPRGALAFLIADAMRPFEAEVATLRLGNGEVHVAYAPDGRQVALASTAGDLALWNVHDQSATTLGVALAPQRAVTWSTDGALLGAGGDDGVVRIWRGGIALRTIAVTSAITDLQFSRDGTRVVAATADGIARIWTLAGETAPLLLDPPAETTAERPPLTSAQFSPDGGRIVVAASDGTVNVWEPGSDRQTTPLRQHAAAVHVARWNPAGDLVATASDDGTARIWDPLRGKLAVASLVHGRNARITDVAWSHDGTRVLTAGTDRMVRIWKLPERNAEPSSPAAARLLAELPHTDTVVACRFSADDRWIATAERVARIWDAEGQLVAAFELADAVRSVAFSPDAALLVTGTRDGTARLWDVTRGVAAVPVNLESPIHAIAIARDGTVAAGRDDSNVSIWNGATSRVLRKHLGRVFAVAFSPDGTQLVTGGEDVQTYVWNLRSSDEPRVLVEVAPPVHAAAYDPAGMTVALGDALGRLWLAPARGTGAARWIAGLDVPVTAIAFNARGDRIAGVGADGTVIIWSSDGAQLARTRVSVPLAAVAFDPVTDALAVGGDGEARVLRLVGRSLVPTLTIEGPTGAVRSIAYSSDGSRLFAGGSDGVAKVWDATKGKLLATRDPHAGAIDAIALSMDDARLWTASADGTARQWDVHAVNDSVDLHAFIARHVPWELGDDDVVKRVTEGHGGSK